MKTTCPTAGKRKTTKVAEKATFVIVNGMVILEQEQMFWDGSDAIRSQDNSLFAESF